MSGAEAADIDVTNFDSGGKREYIKGVIEYTDVELSGVWNGGTAVDTLLRNYQLNAVETELQFQIPVIGTNGSADTFEITYEGYVKTYTNEIDYENAGSFTLGFKVNGVVSA